MKIIIKSFMQGHFHWLKSLFDILQVVAVICNYLIVLRETGAVKLGKIKDIAVHNLRTFGIFYRHLLRGNIRTQFVRQNVKITFSVQPTHAPLKTSGVTKYFVVKHRIQVPLETDQLQKGYLLYHDNFVRPKQKILQSKQQNP